MDNESSLRRGLVGGAPRGGKIAYWISTCLFAAVMAMSGVVYLTQPTMAEAFRHLGFPSYFRVELAIAKLLTVVALLAPVPANVKEWAYAGFGITLFSAVVAHANVDSPVKIVPPLVAAMLLIVSYLTSPQTALRVCPSQVPPKK